jgi:imidazoleglycerol phosphate dehydratase HisB
MLARDLRVEIEALADLADREMAVVEGALRAADVANLAASTLAELPGTLAPEAAASAHMAAGAARALHALAEAGGARMSGERGRNALADARGVTWRAQLAARQVDESLEYEG